MTRTVARRRENRPILRRAAGVLLSLALGVSSPGSSQPVDAVPPPDADGPLPTIALEEIRKGDRGYGLSVFSGTERERFEVEVVGIMRNVSPGQDYLLARLSGRGLEDTGVIAGMSGSPVFVDEKLVGAVAFAWPFAKEAIAGITPIGAMREMGRGVPAPPPAVPTSGPAPRVEDLLPTWDDPVALLEQAMTRLRPSLPADGASSIAWGVTGFDPGRFEVLRRVLGPVAMAGEALPGDGPVRIRPGDPVAAVLVDGDLRLAATGTVTDRDGDDVLAFGHSFLGLGDIAVPMAEAEVVTVLSNQVNSFKIANFGREVGAFHEDREVGIRGVLGASAPTIPLEIAIEEGPSFSMRLARVPEITPFLVAFGVLGAQSAAWQSAGTIGLDLEAEFDLGERGELSLAQSFDGAQATSQAAFYLLSFSQFFLQNSFAEVPLDGIRVRLRPRPEPRTATLVGGYAERTEVRPGEEVTLHLDLVPYRGEPMRHHVTIRVPSDVPAGKYYVLVGDGVTMDGARIALEKSSPVRFDQAMEMIRGFHSRRQIVALGLHRGNGLSVAGEVLPRIPGTVQSIWSAAASKSATPLPLNIAQEHTEWLEVPVEGSVRIDLDVKRRTPVSAADTEGGETSTDGVEGDGSGDAESAEGSGTGTGQAAEESGDDPNQEGSEKGSR